MVHEAVVHEALTQVPVMDLAWPVMQSVVFVSAWTVAVHYMTGTTARRQIHLSRQTKRKHVLTRVVGVEQPRAPAEQMHQQAWVLAHADALVRPALLALAAQH